MWDTSIPLFGIKFLVLFIASLLITLVVLLPLNFFLLFTKLPLQIRCLAKYLKPYLDAFQAPFKDNCCYFPGLELIIRWVSFAIGSRFLTSANKRLALDNSICVILLMLLCTFKPFKTLTNTILYLSYVINLQCILILLISTNFNTTKTYYVVVSHALIFIALAEFGATILYHLYTSHLQKIKLIKSLVTKVNNACLKCYDKFKVSHASPPSVAPLADYEQLQEELLLADPSQ